MYNDRKHRGNIKLAEPCDPPKHSVIPFDLDFVTAILIFIGLLVYLAR